MQKLIQEIQVDIDWRVSELATIKTLPTKYNMTEHYTQTLIWYSIPSIYAIWEGFMKNSLHNYISFINRKNISINELDINIITNTIDNECQLADERTHFKTKKNLVCQIFKIFKKNPINMSPIEFVGSNLNYKSTNEILEKFNLPPIDISFKKPLDKLLFFRNHIAHGENSIKVKKIDIEIFTLLIGDLMVDILLKIDESTKNKSYKFISN